MKRYQLVTLKPESVLNALQEIGDLDPRTMLQMDSDAKVIFANATPKDHEKIGAIIDKLDGSGRDVEVIWLRRLPADQVAVSIRNLLVQTKKEKQNNNYDYYYMSRYGSNNDDKDKPESDFRVEPDIENNRLLLYANEQELEAVNRLLIKLGELPGEHGNPNRIRVQDPRDAKETAEILRKLRELWPSLSDNPIEIKGAVPVPKTTDENEPASAPEPESDEKAEPKTAVLVPSRSRVSQPIVLPAVFPKDTASGTPAAAETPDESTGHPRSDTHSGNDAFSPAVVAGDPSKPPVTISFTEDGRIVMSSNDTAALDQLEDLLARVAPPAKSHRVFYLQYALASLVTINLEEYFEGDESYDTEENWMRAWMGMDFKPGKQKDSQGLASRRAVRFIYDIDTNSILVRDATPAQMSTIEELIEVYDQAPSEESISARRLQVFRLKYSDANVVAATIKDVFRDLLSSKDKEFANNTSDDKEKRSSSSSFFRIFGGGDDDKDKKGTKVKASFEGALSIGVDALSNTVIVSAQEEWLPSIEKIIEYMDENAKPETTVSVQSIAVPMGEKTMLALQELMRPWPGNKRPESKAAGETKASNGQPNPNRQQSQQQGQLQPAASTDDS